MVKAVLHDKILAEGNDTVIVDRKHYFRPEDVNWEYFEESDHQTICSWKGTASYYHIIVDGRKNENAAWYYPDAKDKAKQIEGRIAFSYIHGVDTFEE
jgi:uncharacterized protein (DUF427 family)